jgi:hypothetical protein
VIVSVVTGPVNDRMPLLKFVPVIWFPAAVPLKLAVNDSLRGQSEYPTLLPPR